MKTYTRYSLLVLLACFAGCAYDPAPDYTPGKTVPPKAGSTFTFKNVATDTLGVPIDSTTMYTRDSVVQTGMTYSGKTNVTDFANVDMTYGFVVSHTYINYETNGDISVYAGGSGGLGGINLPDWRTYNVQSHTTAGSKIGDTTLTIPGLPLPVHIVANDTMSFVGNDTYSVSGNKIPVFKAKEVLSYTASAFLLSLKSSTTNHIEFAPSFGYIVSQITDPTIIPAFIPSQGGYQVTLTAYSLK